MSKKFRKFLSFTLLTGAAAAAAIYFLKNREAEDKFEDSDNDVNDDLEEFLQSEDEAKEDSRSYVPLNFDQQNDANTESQTAADNDSNDLSSEPEEKIEAANVSSEPSSDKPEAPASREDLPGNSINGSLNS